ncbi:hypothetical protein FS749_008496 [Ceratobasidium sp. UAMH 11750]|nr:hypothetical protein FS749_008496 [Ceratobasidium sp. UAMH 11750]
MTEKGFEVEFAHAARVETCPRRIEANWNFLWEAKLQQEITRIGGSAFRCSGQLALFERHASAPLEHAGPPTTTPNDSDEAAPEVAPFDDEPDPDLSEDDSVQDDPSQDDPFQDSPTKSKSRRLKHDDRAYPGKKTDGTPGTLSWLIRPRKPAAPSIDQSPTVENAPVTPPRPKNSSVDPPDTNKSVPARRGKDRWFYVDFAVVKLAIDPDPEKPVKTLMGFKDIPLTKGDIPILMELKCCIPRTQGARLETMEVMLNRYINDGFSDLRGERNAAFQTYSSQESLVGISMTGPWWSFCLLKPGSVEDRTRRSQVFVLGSQSHDKLLSTIINAAYECPQNPLAYQEGILGKYIEKFRFNRVFHSVGCLAPLTIALDC